MDNFSFQKTFEEEGENQKQVFPQTPFPRKKDDLALLDQLIKNFISHFARYALLVFHKIKLAIARRKQNSPNGS